MSEPAPRSVSLSRIEHARFRATNRRGGVLTFGEGDTIDGKVPTGSGTSVTGRKFDRGPSLIHIREDFRAEIIKAAEDLD